MEPGDVRPIDLVQRTSSQGGQDMLQNSHLAIFPKALLKSNCGTPTGECSEWAL
jgi:hypothetical protein